MNFTAARSAYLAHAWDSMVITRERAAMALDARKVLAKKPIYTDVEQETGVPWWFVAVVDMREGGIEHLGTRHLHNGDHLTAYTVNEPRGRPQVGHGPPFTWRESAIDSIEYQGLDKIKRWTIERALHQLESYNGFKYALQRPPRPSPYDWSCCSIYDPPGGPGGKVLVDHGPIVDIDPKTGGPMIDPQYGCAPFLRVLAELDSTIHFAREAAAPSVLPPTGATAKGGAVIVAGTAAGKAAAGMGFSPGLVVFLAFVGAFVVAAGIYFVSNRSK